MRLYAALSTLLLFLWARLADASMGFGSRCAAVSRPMTLPNDRRRRRDGAATASGRRGNGDTAAFISNSEHRELRTGHLLLYSRGGHAATTIPSSQNFVRVVRFATSSLVVCGKMVLPTVVATTKFLVQIYRWLPKDTIILQTGLVYCFLGGYYPTLFSALSAAQNCGWPTMLRAIDDLTIEALRVMDAAASATTNATTTSKSVLFRQRTSLIMATIDPMLINQAAGSLYTTWLGVSTTLQRDYVRVITLSMTLARGFERIAQLIIAPPAYFVVEEQYHQWVPFLIGWLSKGLAMSVAWRIQRVLTAGTSAITGGLMVSRALMRILSRRGIRMFGLIRLNHEESPLDEFLGLLVGGLGFYTQIEAQYKSGFSFNVPFPLSLITWPFDWAERWIQWQITK